MTLPELDRSSERPVQIRQAARRSFIETQDCKTVRRALWEAQTTESVFLIGCQVAMWRKVTAVGTVSWVEALFEHRIDIQLFALPQEQ